VAQARQIFPHVFGRFFLPARIAHGTGGRRGTCDQIRKPLSEALRL